MLQRECDSSMMRDPIPKTSRSSLPLWVHTRGCKPPRLISAPRLCEVRRRAECVCSRGKTRGPAVCVQTVQVVHQDLRHLKRSRVAFQTRFEATSCPPARSGDPAYPRGRTQSKSATSSSTSDGNPQPPARSDYLLPFASLQRECDSSVMRDSIPKTSRSS
jgi:hypothetical protein